MLTLGHVYADSEGQHPLTSSSYCGQAVLQTHQFNSPDDPPSAECTWHSIMLAAPASMHRQVLDARPPIRATAALVPWAGSGIGLLVVHAAADAVLAVMDIAGRSDLTELQTAAHLGKVAAGIATDEDPAVTPLVPLAGFGEAISDARSMRRLAGRELVTAVAEVRAILRGPWAHRLLGIPSVSRLDSLTVNICPLSMYR